MKESKSDILRKTDLSMFEIETFFRTMEKSKIDRRLIFYSDPQL